MMRVANARLKRKCKRLQSEVDALRNLPLSGPADEGHGSEAPGEPGPSGHDRMLVLLRQIADRTVADHPLLSEKRSVQLREQLAAVPDDAHPQQKLGLHLALGEEELRQNRLEEGIGFLDQAYRNVERFPEAATTEGMAKPWQWRAGSKSMPPK